jgi:hypothetical protein
MHFPWAIFMIAEILSFFGQLAYLSGKISVKKIISPEPAKHINLKISISFSSGKMALADLGHHRNGHLLWGWLASRPDADFPDTTAG